MAEQVDQVESQRTPGRTGWRRWITFVWVRTPLGLLKIGECAVLLLGMIIMSSIPYSAGYGASSIGFFMFVTSTAWVAVLITLFLYMLNIFEKLPSIVISNIAFAIVCGTAVLSLLIACSIVMHEFWFDDRALAAGSFGLLAMFLFLFEFVYYFINLRRNGARSVDSNPTSGAQDIAKAMTEPTSPPDY